jgi:hypothetical protein
MSSKESHNLEESASDFHLPSFLGTLEEEEKLIERLERQNKASQHLDKTIFPELLKKMAKDPNFIVEDILYDKIWDDMNEDSIVLDLFWDLHPTGIEKAGEVMLDTYNAKAISVEMLPNGNLIVRGDSDYGTTVLLSGEWNDKKLQKKAFDKAFANPKTASFSSPINTPLGRA